MFGNGVKTGMAIIVHTIPIILRELLRALTACSAVVAGTAMLLTAECRVVASMVRVAVTATAVSASSVFLSINTKIRKLS